MWNAISVPDSFYENHPYTLAEDVSAIELVRMENGKARLGLISKIPEGAEIYFCGEGFNDRTIKVRWQNQLYFVFVDDLRAQRKPLAMSASG